jgi:hypothetical protein
MKKIKIISLLLLLPVIASLLLACDNHSDGEVIDDGHDHGAETYFQAIISTEHPWNPGEIIITAKDPNAAFTVESFSEINPASVTFLMKTETESFWVIVLNSKTEDDTVVAIDKLTYRSDLKSAVPNYITEAE